MKNGSREEKFNVKNIRNIKFTLIELLVVVAIIAILLSILLPSLANARKSGMSAVSMNNLKQIYAGTMAYVTNEDGRLFLAGTNPHPRTGYDSTNWSRMVWEQLKGEYLSFNGTNAKKQMAEGTAYYSTMYCPLLRMSRPVSTPSQASGSSDYSMNKHFKNYRRLAKLDGKIEPMWVPGTKVGDQSANKHFSKGTYDPTQNQRPVYEYTNNKSLGLYVDGQVKFFTKSDGVNMHSALSNKNDFQ